MSHCDVIELHAREASLPNPEKTTGRGWGKLIHHADGGDDGIQGKYKVEQENLHDDPGQGCAHRIRGTFLLAFEALVDFVGALTEQKTNRPSGGSGHDR